MQRLLAILLLTTSCCSCAHLDDVERDWGLTMARYKMIGVFPITEDLQPGDILLDVPPASYSDPQPQVTRLGSLEPALLTTALKRQDKLRLRFQGQPEKPTTAETKPAENKAPGSTVSAVATAQPGTAITTTTTIRAAPASASTGKSDSRNASKPDPNVPAQPNVVDADTPQTAVDPTPRFRRVALPGIIAARVYNWQVAGAGPIGRLAVGLGLSGNGSAAVLITLRKLQMLGFDALAADNLFQDNVVIWLRQNTLAPRRLLSLTYRANPEPVARICQGRPAPDDGARALIRVVDRVMYAHEIQYEYNRSNNVAGRLAADISEVPTSSLSRSFVPVASGSTSTSQQDAITAVTTTSGATDLENGRLATLQADLSSASPSVPGVRATVGIGTYGNAALNESYLRPMAVGFNVVTSYAVRDSFVITATDQEHAKQQLVDARYYCGSRFGESFAQLSSPIVKTICTNTADLKSRQPDKGVTIPEECAGQFEYQATPFREIGRQRRDLQPRSF